MINCQWVIVNIHYLLLIVHLPPLSIYSSSSTPLYFSTKAAILRKTLCFLVRFPSQLTVFLALHSRVPCLPNLVYYYR